MDGNEKIITKSEFEVLQRNRIPFEGYVSGLVPDSRRLCFVMSKPVVFVLSINEKNSEFTFGTTIEYVIVPLSNEKQGAWIRRKGKKEYFYDRDVTSESEAKRKYGNDIDYVTEGSTLKVTDTRTGAEVEKYRFFKGGNNKGLVIDKDGEHLDPSQIVKTEGNSTIFGTSDNSLNAGTLHNNLFSIPYEWFGRRIEILPTTYTGPWNPKTYGDGNPGSIIDNYDHLPELLSDWAAFYHDKDYDALGLIGPTDAILNTKGLKADIKLTLREIGVVMNTKASIDDKVRAGLVATAFGAISVFKVRKLANEKTVEAGKNVKKDMQKKAGEAYMKSHMSPNLRYWP